MTKPFTSDELLSATLRAASSTAQQCAASPPPPGGVYRLGVHSWVRVVQRSRVLSTPPGSQERRKPTI